MTNASCDHPIGGSINSKAADFVHTSLLTFDDSEGFAVVGLVLILIHIDALEAGIFLETLAGRLDPLGYESINQSPQNALGD